jgi:curved DNA-binding protein CbpA
MDSFAVLGLPRKLALEPGSVEDAVRERAKLTHPDAGGDEELFAEIRRAGDLLKSPGSRLKVALELSGADPSERGSVPSGLMDFFSPVAGALEEVNGFVAERGKAVSGLGKAVLDVRIPGIKGRLETLMEGLAELEAEEVGKLAGFDRGGWENCLGEMGEASRTWAFLGKWQAQLREATGKIFEALFAG